MPYRRIRDLREDADLSQRQIAEIIHMHKTTYTRYETGEREIPFNIAILLAKQYKVSLDYIAGLTDRK
ncbi:MAG: helix-turn-helix domain-containing protein [Oscillospiraceae bacterium]|nr:helix-turn-helix domain-containing protein [Oscillospiraceae bacterium]